MASKFTIETVGDMRKALAGISDDTPFQILCDGADYRKLESQLCYPGDREQFVRFETVD